MNTALGNLTALERLNLFYNVLSRALKEILSRLRFTYPNVTKCHLMDDDLLKILSFSFWVHIDS